MNGIRLGDIPDINEICKIASEFLAVSIYADIKPDEEKFRLFVAGLMGIKNGIVIVVVDDNDKPQGFLLGVIDELFFSRQRMATDVAFYVREGYRNLAPKVIRHFIGWAEQKPRMAQITLGISSGIGNPDRTGKLYETFGAENVGGIYVKRIKRK